MYEKYLNCIKILKPSRKKCNLPFSMTHVLKVVAVIAVTKASQHFIGYGASHDHYIFKRLIRADQLHQTVEFKRVEFKLPSLIRTTYFIMIFASCHFVLSHLPNFNSITGVSLVAPVMSLTYSTIAWTASVYKGIQPNVQYTDTASTTTRRVFNFFSALGDVAFAYVDHNVVLEIQSTIPSTLERPSKGPMWKGVIFAYIVVVLCYFPVALIGHWMFGNNVADNILITLEKPRWLIAAANMFVVIHVIGSYQIYAMPVFDMLETLLVKKLKFTPCFRLRLITRTLYVAFTMFIAILLPFFGSLLGFLGGFVFSPTTYFLPCIIWLIIYKPKRFSLSWFIN